MHFVIYEGNNFKNLRGLDHDVVGKLLRDVYDKKLSIQEMMVECKQIKGMREIQSTFLR